MALTVTFKVEGLVALQARLNRLAEDVQRRVARAATNAGAQVVKAEAKRRAPVAKRPHLYYPEKGAPGVMIQPGNLRENIVVRRRPPRQTPYLSEHVVTVRHKGKKVVGDPFLEGVLAEYGTVRTSPRPWLRPSFEATKEAAATAIKAKLEDAIRKRGA